MTNRASWAQGKMAGFDTETTGVDVEQDRIVTACLIVVKPNCEPVTHSWLMDPGVEIPAEAAAIHGITTEHARERGRAPEKCLAEIGEVLAEHWSGGGDPLVGYNVPFDLTIFDRECARHELPGVDLGGRRCVDPLAIDRGVERYRKGGRKLGSMCAAFGIPLGEEAHNAEADTLATLRLAYKQAARYPRQVGLVDLDALHATQPRWHSEWCRGMGTFLRREAAKLEAMGARLAVDIEDAQALAFVREKFARLDIGDAPTAEAVERVAKETRARAADIAGGAADWPMRLRPVGEEAVAG